ncbi:Protein downstream neighbor of son-like protein [Aphelenchoides besseyi]|nr:Protein downstream neighbor of son-like protein [Aphelenchoides besseyi]KAI6193629.1 Protein downstream neighbor of son-like protein [Aphelenchoides besseyi]
MSSPRKSPRRSPLKRVKNVNFSSIGRTITKRPAKRKLSELFATNEKPASKPVAKKLFELYDESLDNSFDEFNWSRLSTKRSTSPVKEFYSTMPVDLRIGTKVRIASSQPFSLAPTTAANNNNNTGDDNNNADASSSKTIQFDCSTNKYARQLLNDGDQRQSSKTVRPLVLLKAAGLFYQYPNDGVKSTFAKTERSYRSKINLTAMPTFGTEESDLIHEEWLESFRDLFESWKAGLRTSFYFIAAQFTILFLRCCSLNASDETCMGLNWEYKIIVTPTTSGFRSMLKRRGISYSLPFKTKLTGKKDSISGTMDSCISVNDSFVDSPSLDISSSNNLMARREGTPERENISVLEIRSQEFISPVKPGEVVELDEMLRIIGSSPSIKMSINESQDQAAARETNIGTTILIDEMPFINSFYELLIDSSKLGWEKTGPKAGVPPKLYATDQFSNSSIRSLKYQTQVLKRSNSTEYTLTLDGGPILPHTLRLLHEYLQASQSSASSKQSFKFNVTGRARYGGLNDAAGDVYKNVSDFEVIFDGFNSRFSY